MTCALATDESPMRTTSTPRATVLSRKSRHDRHQLGYGVAVIEIAAPHPSSRQPPRTAGAIGIDIGPGGTASAVTVRRVNNDR
jgi:hypothetical protein